MADSVNGQYSAPPFGMGRVDSTGAPGSTGAGQADTMADSAYSVVVNGPFDSVQNVPPRTVGVGADDVNQPGQGREGISGISVFGTGAGAGSVAGPHHPNASGGRS